jgi:hypothetical protein
MQHRLYGLRGDRFVSKYKELYSALSPQIRIDFEAIVFERGKFTAQDLGSLCMKHQIPLTVMDDWLPEITCGQYSSGTWDRLRGTGVKAKDLGVSWN